MRKIILCLLVLLTLFFLVGCNNSNPIDDAITKQDACMAGLTGADLACKTLGCDGGAKFFYVVEVAGQQRVHLYCENIEDKPNNLCKHLEWYQYVQR